MKLLQRIIKKIRNKTNLFPELTLEQQCKKNGISYMYKDLLDAKSSDEFCSKLSRIHEIIEQNEICHI